MEVKSKVLRAIAAPLLAGGLVLAGPGVLSADPWKDESGHGRHGGGHFGGDHFRQEWKPGKYEWRAGDCKYEFKQDSGGFKEEYKCDGGPGLAAFLPERFLPYGYHGHGDRGHGDRGHGGEGPVFVLGPEVSDAGEGRYCREYQKRVVVGGSRQDAYGIACYQPDGSWQLMN